MLGTIPADPVGGGVALIPGLFEAAPQVIGMLVLAFFLLRSQQIRERARAEEQQERDKLHAGTVSKLISALRGLPPDE